ncbi:outer membrane protein assembly factor BamB family protein [Lignipirellula cremea]|uniref:Quinoprotein ethanol dehydrogenase n=1 Tax=Lignipirellula cremea TaxID=2528010 RepID=A0A518DQ06_9BACT|nr:PQQ-binding-like beta-propeller repeat protein [Lignipirellula cremea]QDU93913.1 Quinoprotein ethanol dehydrogenase precursor [Lignipirellula cremea]
MLFSSSQKLAALIAAGLVVLAVSVAVARTWSDASGMFSIEAEFVAFSDGKVQLKKETGDTIVVPMLALSKPDQEWVREELARRKAGGAPAAETPTARDTNQAAVPGDWPQWRGPKRDGVNRETGLLESWPAGGPELLWTAQGLGSGYASVSVANGKIYTMGAVGDGQRLMALSTEDGKEIWSTEISRKRDKPNCTPTVDGDLVFGLSLDGVLLCCNAETGQEVWRKRYADDFGGRMMSNWGYSESPLVDGDRLICTPGGDRAMVVALDKRTGREIWSTPMPRGGDQGSDGAGYASLVISNAGGVRQYVTLVGRGVIGVRASDGELLWGYNRVANGTANCPTPIVEGDYVFCSSGYGDGGSALLKLSNRQGRFAAQEVYYRSAKEVQNHHGGMILVDGFVYMGHGHNQGLPLCLKLETGQLAWGPERGPGGNSAAILYADGKLYFRYENGVMALIEATPRGYNPISDFRLPTNNDKSWPHPVIANGKLYLRDGDVLHCYHVKK